MNNTHKASKPISYNQLLEYIKDDMIGKPFPYEEFDLEKARLLAYSHGTYYGLTKPQGTFGYSIKKEGKK